MRIGTVFCYYGLLPESPVAHHQRIGPPHRAEKASMAKRKIKAPAAYLRSHARCRHRWPDGFGRHRYGSIRYQRSEQGVLDEGDRYPEPQHACITLSGVRSALVDLEFGDLIWISEARVSRCYMEPGKPLELTMNLHGAARKMTSGWPASRSCSATWRSNCWTAAKAGARKVSVHRKRRTNSLARFAAEEGRLTFRSILLTFISIPSLACHTLPSTCGCRRCWSISSSDADDPIYIIRVRA